ncbi:MAG: FAD-dependent oxidoreductase [Actinocatenispora sp.]
MRTPARPELSRLVGRAWGMTRRRQMGPVEGAGRSRSSDPPRVVVVGAGVAGMSAAIVLAERGVPVTVCEAADRPGGRLSATPYRLGDGSVQLVDHGFHGFFRQYYNWRGILDRIDGGRDLLRPLGSYPVISHRWPDEEFDRLPPTPPLSTAALVARSPSLRLRDLARADHRVALSMVGFDARQTYRYLDRTSAADLLDAMRLPARARATLFNVFAHSFFNDAAAMSAADLVAMFHFYFLGNPEGLGMDAPRADHQTAIWTPLAEHLTRHGGELRCGTAVAGIHTGRGTRWQVRTVDGSTLAADRVVLATDVVSAGRILAGSPALTAGDTRLAAVAARPPVGPPYAVARYWLSGDVAADRAQFTSIGDPGVLDSVTLYHRIDEQAGRWHERTGGAVVELHAYACPAGVPADELGETMRAELAGFWPEVTGLTVLDRRCHVGTDAAGFPVGGHPQRPGVRTRLTGVGLAGDWVGVPVPSALMERAATTGILAANVVLSGLGGPVEPVWSVPPRGMLADRWAAQCRRTGAWC